MNPSDRKSNKTEPSNWESDLDSIQAAYSSLAADEPPELLDQMVLNTARRDLAKRRRRPLRWIGAFASVSVVVLALTIVLQQDPEPVQPDRSGDSRTNAVSAKESIDNMAGRSVEEVRTAQDAIIDDADHEQLMMEHFRIEKREDRPAVPAVNSSVSATLQAVPQAMPAAVLEHRVEVAESYPAEEPALEISIELLRDQAFEEEADSNAGTFALGQEIEDEPPRQMRQKAPPGDSLNESELDETAETQADPEIWIEYLLELSASDKTEKLQQELTAFKLAYPEFELPPELMD